MHDWERLSIKASALTKNPNTDRLLLNMFGFLLVLACLAYENIAFCLPPIHLSAPRNYVTGSIPSQVIPMDLDGDGDMDAVVKCVGSLSDIQLQLFENPGNGTLTFHSSIVLPSANELVSADLNGDGRMDLVQVHTVATINGQLDTWVRNNPFSFSTQSVSLPFSASHLAVGNMDGANGLDMVIGDDTASPLIHVYLSTAGGGYVLQGTYDSESTFRDVNQDGNPDTQTPIRVLHCLCSDLDGDGDDDVAVVNSIQRNTGNNLSQVTDMVTLANLGGGTLGPYQILMNTGGTVMGIADMDGDGDRDIVSKSVSLTGPDLDDVIILKNAGNGIFSAPEWYSSGSGSALSAGSVRLTDVDLDGDWDVGLTHIGPLDGNLNDSQTDRWALLRNNGNGSLGTPETYPAGAEVLDLAFADLDGEAGPEALCVAGDDDRLSVHYNAGGRYPTPTLISVDDSRYTSFGSAPMDIAGGDFNNDGMTDLAVVAEYSTMVVGPDVLVLLYQAGNGATPSPVFRDLAQAGPNRIYVDQIAGSAAEDIGITFIGDDLYGQSPGVGLSLGVAGGLPASLQFASLNGMPSDLAPLDVNSDGIKDMAVLRIRDEGLTAGVSVLSVSSTGAMTYLGDLVLGSDDVMKFDTRLPEVVCSPDMNGDGYRDLVAVTYNLLGTASRIITVFLNNGDLSFNKVGEFSTVGREITDIIGTDVTGDNLPDIVLTSVSSLTDTNQDGSLEVLPNLGGGVLGTGVSYNVGKGPVRVVAAQMDGSAGMDLVIANDGSNEVTVLFNNGTGSFPVQERYLSGGGTDGLTAADMDTDGDMDIAVCNDNHATDRHYGTVSIIRSRLLDVSAPSVPDLLPGSDTGRFNTDNITSDTTPTFTGTADPGMIIKLYDGTEEVGNTTADGGGSWTITSTPLADGVHNLSAVAENSVGGMSDPSSALMITIDATAPRVLSIKRSDPAVATTNVDTVGYLVTFSETTVWDISVSNFDLSTTGVSGASISSVSGSGSTRTVSVSTGSGNGTLRLRMVNSSGAADEAGNSVINLPFAGELYTIDKTIPVVDAGTDVSRSTAITLTATATDNAAMTYKWVLISGPGTLAFGSPTALTTTIFADCDGVYTIRFTATDSAGNSSWDTILLTWDDEIPSVLVDTTDSDPGPFNLKPVSLRITFSMDVTEFNINDLFAVNGSLSGFSGSGSAYQVDITPASEGEVAVYVPAGAAKSATGKYNEESNHLYLSFKKILLPWLPILLND